MSRFSLRALLVAILVIAVMTSVLKFGWGRFVVYRDGRDYSAVHDAKQHMLGDDDAMVTRGPIPDDFIILVRKENVFGCFIPRQQMQKGESLRYDWYYRTDGLGKFDANDKNVHSGESFAKRPGHVRIAFGSFSMAWTGHCPGWGYVYYPTAYYAIVAKAGEHVKICATNRKSIRYLDARSPEWVYKSHQDDPGVRGDEDIISNNETTLAASDTK